MPRIPALRRSAPTVRFIVFETLATGVLALECVFNSRTSSLVHGFECATCYSFCHSLILRLLFRGRAHKVQAPEFQAGDLFQVTMLSRPREDRSYVRSTSPSRTREIVMRPREMRKSCFFSVQFSPSQRFLPRLDWPGSPRSSRSKWRPASWRARIGVWRTAKAQLSRRLTAVTGLHLALWLTWRDVVVL